MKQGNSYSNERTYPKNSFGKKLQLVKTVESCTCQAVANDDVICYATEDFKVHIEDIRTLKTIREIDTRKLPGINKKNIDKRNTYLFLSGSILLIQVSEYYYKYDIKKDDSSLLFNEDDITVVAEAVLINDNIYEVSSSDNSIKSTNIQTGGREVETPKDDISKFLASYKNILFHTDESHVFGYDVSAKKTIWQTPVAESGNYYDEAWKEDKKGIISQEAIVVNQQLITCLEQGKVIALDCLTGKINWTVPVEGINIPRLMYMPGDKVLYVYAGDMFSVNLDSGVIESQLSLADEFEQQELESGFFSLSANNFYIATGSGKSALVVVNKATGKIEEVHDLDDHCFHPPSVIGKYLVLRDDSSHLYFFTAGE